MAFKGTFPVGSLMLRVTRWRISRSWLTVVAVAAVAGFRAASAGDMPPLFPEAMSAGEIQLALQKLNVLGDRKSVV